MRKKLSVVGLIRFLSLLAIIVLLLITVKRFDALTASVGFSFLAIGVLLILLDYSPILVEEVPSIYELAIAVNGTIEHYEIKLNDLGKTMWFLNGKYGSFEVVSFDQVTHEKIS